MGFKHVDPVLRGAVTVEVPKGSRVSRERVVLVLAYLANRANPSGIAYPAVRTIADELSIPRSAVQTALRVLEAQGLITAEGGRSGGAPGQTTRWQLPEPPTGPTGRAPTGPTHRAPTGPTDDATGPTHASEGPDPSGTKRKEADEEAVERDPASIAGLLNSRARRDPDLIGEAEDIEIRLLDTYGEHITRQAIADAHRCHLTAAWPSQLRTKITAIADALVEQQRAQRERTDKERIARRATCTTCDGAGVLFDDHDTVTGNCPTCSTEAVA